MEFGDALRRIKHRISTAARPRANRIRWALEDRRAIARESRPYSYHHPDFAHTFVARPSPEVGAVLDVPERVFVIWLGGPMSGNRERSLRAIRDGIGVPVELVTERNIADFLVSGHQLHPAFDYLTSVHRSDVLRAYLLHHHGGGYIDVKQPTASWVSVFAAFSDPSLEMVGYRERTAAHLSNSLLGMAGVVHRKYFRQTFGTSAYVARPQSVVTTEWMRELERRLDYMLPALVEAGDASTDPYATSAEYPIAWTEILGDIIQPLCLKHGDRIRFDERLAPVLSSYR